MNRSYGWLGTLPTLNEEGNPSKKKRKQLEVSSRALRFGCRFHACALHWNPPPLLHRKPAKKRAVAEEATTSVYPAPAVPAATPRIIRINPPITVKQLAAELGLQPNQLIAELMSFNIFVNINQTIETDIASKICEKHGSILEKERREKGAAVRKDEPVLKSPSPLVIKDAATITSLEQVMHKLHADTVLFLHTADTLAAVLREYDLDWCPAVIMLCKAFEKETNVRLLVPLREKTSGRDLKADISDEDLGRIARFCAAAGQPPELGTLGHFLNTAIHSKQRRASSILLQSFYELVSDWPRSQWLVDELGLAAALKRLTKEFRNPAAHIEKLSESEFGNCRNFVRSAPEMVLLRLFLATSR
jgi:Translation initiation factor IF-2, N-terminal region